MVFYLIGLGLGDEKDITVKGLEIVKGCARVYLEHYTAIIGVPLERLEKFYGRSVQLADREVVESHSEILLEGAATEDVAFLVVGDVFAATTHTDLVLRAAEQNIPWQVVHNASIMNAVSACGLQLYNFGQSVSICFFTDTWKPDSFYAKIKANKDQGFHTLCLLDIKVKEQSFENMTKGIKEYEPPRYMTVNQCLQQLLYIENQRKEGVYSANTLAVGLARVGQHDQKIVTGTIEELINIDFGEPLHSVVIPAEVHFIEQRMLDHYHWDQANRQKATRLALEQVEAARLREREGLLAARHKEQVERDRTLLLRKQQEQEARERIIADRYKEEDGAEEAVAVPLENLSLFGDAEVRPGSPADLPDLDSETDEAEKEEIEQEPTVDVVDFSSMFGGPTGSHPPLTVSAKAGEEPADLHNAAADFLLSLDHSGLFGHMPEKKVKKLEVTREVSVIESSEEEDGVAVGKEQRTRKECADDGKRGKLAKPKPKKKTKPGPKPKPKKKGKNKSQDGTVQQSSE